MMSDERDIRIPQFDGSHYDHWSELMENLLRAKGLWNIIETGIEDSSTSTAATLTPAQQTKLEEFKVKDCKVKHFLYLGIDRVTFEQILDRRTAKIVWESLKSKFGGNERVKRSLLNTLRRDFEVLEMKNAETIKEYFARVMTVANKMRSNGEMMADSKIVENILRTLTERFMYVVVSIEEARDTSLMTIDELQSCLVVHEQKFKKLNVEDDQVLRVDTATFGRRRGRGRAEVRGRGRGIRFYDKSTVECYRCHKLGHLQYECPTWEHKNRAHYANAELAEEEEVLLMAHTETHITKENKDWVIDSGCSNHMSGNKSLFTNLDQSYRHSVTLGDGTCLKVMGKGDAKLTMGEGKYVLEDVYFIPQLKTNLLSMGQLQEKRVTILVGNDECRLYHHKSGLFFVTKMAKNRIFKLAVDHVNEDKKKDEENCYQTAVEDKTHLWHCRFGHTSYKNLQIMQSKGMVEGLPVIKLPEKRCSHCCIGKQHRNKLPKRSTWRASKRLELVHSDICGPITPTSNSKKRNLTECSKCILDFGGRCVYDAISSTQIACFCDNGLLCGSGTKPNSKRWKLIVICVAAGMALALLSLFSVFLFKRKKSLAMSSCSPCFGREAEAKRNAREFIKTYQSTVLRNYTYNDLTKMTDGFKEKLGKGGFGSVFKGTFPDGTPIAVKMLENHGDHERSDFLNEITTISMIRHFNIIRLLGFSWDGSKQALVYEFMPNGSIGDLLGGSSIVRPRKLLEIAMGAAHGIEYLHIGCDVRILHLDIKPQNILLDENLNPKISDFGLAMTYSRNQSVITISGGAKGTIGYIAPEIFMRTFGKPSDKSDVYSFGMLLLEMAGAKDRPLDHEQREGSSSSQDYFPNWVYEKLVTEINQREIVEVDEEEEEDMVIRRKIAMVGLWCIQVNPRHRPSMTRVIEMLSANMNIEMPPKPLSFFSSGQQILEHEITSSQSEDSTLPLTEERN